MLRRALRNGWDDCRRNKFLTFGTIVVIGLIFFVFNLILALRLATESVIDKVGEKIDISVEVLAEVEPYSVETLLATLRRHPDVLEVISVSSEEALKRFGTKYPNVITFLEKNEIANPLPHTIRIVSRDVERNNDLIAYLNSPSFSRLLDQEKLLKNQEQKTRHERILEITRFLKSVGLGLNLIFAIVVLLILLNSIGLNIHAHQHEIRIMRLLGARLGFIRSGFFFEGILFAWGALFISVLASKFFLGWLTTHLLQVIQNESLLAGLNAILLHFEDRFTLTLLWEFAGAGLLGLAGSALALQVYLKKQPRGL